MGTNNSDMLRHIAFLAKLFRKEDIHYVASLLLMELGVSTSRAGYDYLVKGITLYLRDPDLIRSVGLYQAIAMQYPDFVTDKQVEHAIRCAIESAWKNYREDDWIRCFPPGSNGKIKKPCNTEFISRIARVLELWEGCCLKNMQEACKEDMV